MKCHSLLVAVAIACSLSLAGCGGDDSSDPAPVVDTTPPSMSSTVPADGATNVAVTSSISMTFDEAMEMATLTVNTTDTTCSGTVQLSSNSFASCVRFGGPLAASNGNKTFTATPASNLSGSTTYKIRVTTDGEDASGNALSSTYVQATGFTTQ